MIDDRIKENILNNDMALTQLRNQGEKKGKSSLRKQGMKRVVNAQTSMQELFRVLGQE